MLLRTLKDQARTRVRERRFILLNEVCGMICFCTVHYMGLIRIHELCGINFKGLHVCPAEISRFLLVLHSLVFLARAPRFHKL